MSASGRTGPDAEARSAPPLLIRRSAHGVLGALVLVVASLWLIAAVRGVLAGDPRIVPGLGSSGAYWAGAVGAALAMLGLHWTVRRQTVAVARDAVVVTERSLLGRHSWREPLANYPEIRGRIEPRPHRYGPRCWYVVLLWHPEPARTIELVRARDPVAVEVLARDRARRFGLPLVWEQPPSIVAELAGTHAADHPVRSGSPGEIAATAIPGRSLSTS